MLLASFLLAAFAQLPTADEKITAAKEAAARRFAEDRARLEHEASRVGASLVRIRAYRVFQLKMYDGRLIREQELEEGLLPGVVVTAEPLIMVSASANRLDHNGVTGFARAPQPKSNNVSDRRYHLILGKDRRVDLQLVHEDKPRNLLFLRPADRGGLAGEIGPPLPIERTRRLSANDAFGVLMFRDIQRGAELFMAAGVLAPGKDAFPRPALYNAGLAHLGCPVITPEGELAGIVNIPPPEEALPAVTVRPLDSSGPANRDPAEWNGGYRRALLMSMDEISPLLIGLIAAYEKPLPIAGLGLTLRNQTGGVFVVASEREGILPGDQILRMGEIAVRSTDGFLAALESAYDEAGGDDPQVVLRRNGEEHRATLGF